MDTVMVILMDTAIAVVLNKNRYIAYFNKCDNVIQLMNYTPAAAPAPAA